MKISRAIRLARSASGLTQAEVSKRAGTGNTTISNIEMGNAASFSVIEKIGKALGISAFQLFILAAEEEDAEGLNEEHLNLMKINVLNNVIKGT